MVLSCLYLIIYQNNDSVIEYPLMFLSHKCTVRVFTSTSLSQLTVLMFSSLIHIINTILLLHIFVLNICLIYVWICINYLDHFWRLANFCHITFPWLPNSTINRLLKWDIQGVAHTEQFTASYFLFAFIFVSS